MAPLSIALEPSVTPTDLLSRLAGLPGLVLLHSAAAEHPLSRYSYLAADPVATASGNAEEWPAFRGRIRATIADAPLNADRLPPFQGGWIGWFAYELGIAFDDVARHPHQPQSVPDVALGLYDWVIAWDHAQQAAWLISTGVDATGDRNDTRARERADAVLAKISTGDLAEEPNARTMRNAIVSDFDAPRYQGAVARVIDYVLAGDIFQANIAQRFTTEYAGDAGSLYRDLTKRSPAPMAAFVHHGNTVVASASPERFIRLDAGSRQVETRPIKGTRPRDTDPVRDAALAGELLASEKDRAENVMIVDLLRNDLSRVCEPGSVLTPALCVLESHATVHHLVSTVTGTLRRNADALDLLAATFPGGSVTGAPKIRAMAIITELEPVARGVYSGAIGWIGLDGSMDTSIAIRTIVVADGIASFHAGGGITARSTPVDEYQENIDKAQALLATLSAGE